MIVPASLFTEQLASRFARIALGHVRREYPNKPGHVLSADADARTPAALHPVFYGSFDWHSCVHSYWLLARVLRRYPTADAVHDIKALFDEQLRPEKVAGECAYFSEPAARGYERPYGWGWLLKLAAELGALRENPWRDAIAPLADVIVARFTDFLPQATYPVRVGTHFNTAFGLRLAADYAATLPGKTFAALLSDTALRWYGEDRACPAWGEPSGDDFLSSALIEAECMRSLAPPKMFSGWFDAFLPELGESMPATLFLPATVSDRSDGKIAHLDGLNLSRAWCWRSLAGALPDNDPRREIMNEAAALHVDAALPHLAEDYMGEHWLASFAALALDGA
ncbi:hypothetical protein HK28_13305 [Acetobacter sp. DsW_063]|nr:hypothetical protein HK28_13305 [Acetobacter sp. DsW_063]